MPETGQIRVGDEYQVTKLPALGDADRTTQVWEIMWLPHNKRFEDRERIAPKLQDRRYNVAPARVWLKSYVHIIRGMAVCVKNYGWGVIVGFRNTENMNPTWKPFLVELINDTTIYISETDIEFARISDDKVGHISILKNGYLHSMEFAPWHVEFGDTHYYKNGYIIRKKFANGQTYYYENGRHVSTKYSDGRVFDCRTPSIVGNKRKVRYDMLESMEALLAKEKVDEAAVLTHIQRAMSKEFLNIDMSNHQQLTRMADRSRELRKNYKSPLRRAYEKVKNALHEFDILAKKANVIDDKDEGYGSA